MMRSVADIEGYPGVEVVRKYLTKKGLTSEMWDDLLAMLFQLPTIHGGRYRDSDPQIRARRQKIYETAKELASALEDDIAIGSYYPYYSNDDSPVLLGSRPQTQPHLLSLWQWLFEYCRELERDVHWPEGHPLAPFNKRQGNSLRTFVVKATYFSLESTLQKGRRRGLNIELESPRVKDTAILASAILGETVKPNDVTQIRKVSRPTNTLE